MTHDDGHHHLDHDPAEDPATYWEGRYAGSSAIWSGRVNATLVAVAETLVAVGHALDLGCGEGGDAVWLAEQGWTVTAVDISATAVARGQAAAEHRGAVADRITWVAADLGTWTPPQSYQLVTASFLHSTVELPRVEILRKAAAAVVPGGHLLMITHAEPPPWAAAAHRDMQMPSPEQDLADLALAQEEWDVLRLETIERTAIGPEGQTGVLRDGIVLLRRR